MKRLSNQPRVKDALRLPRLTPAEQAEHERRNVEQAQQIRDYLASVAKLGAEGRQE